MKIELKQAFETLGVPVSASASDVRSAYRTLIRANHPDHVAGDRTVANDRLAEINAAKDLIDRNPAPRVEAPRKPKAAPTKAASPSSTAQDQEQRAAEARAFRKAMEARANAETEAEARARRAAEEVARARSAELDRQEAAKRASEEMRRQRQAAFAAAMNGQMKSSPGGSLFGRLRSFGSA